MPFSVTSYMAPVHQLRFETGSQVARVRFRPPDLIAKVAPLPSSVLFTGESGSGKEVAARSLHALSARASHPFIPINCAAVPSELIDVELFGSLKGTFSGANSPRQDWSPMQKAEHCCLTKSLIFPWLSKESC